MNVIYYDANERERLSKLLELPELFNSNNDFHGNIATREDPKTELKSASVSVSVLDEVASARDNDRLSKLLSLGNPDLSFMANDTTAAVQLKSASVNRPDLSHKNAAIQNMIAKEEAEQSNDKLSKLLKIPGLFMNK